MHCLYIIVLHCALSVHRIGSCMLLQCIIGHILCPISIIIFLLSSREIVMLDCSIYYHPLHERYPISRLISIQILSPYCDTDNMITSSTHLCSAFDTKFYIIDIQIRVRCEQPPVQCVRHQADELLRFEGPRSLHVLTHTDRYTDTLYTTHYKQSQ